MKISIFSAFVTRYSLAISIPAVVLFWSIYMLASSSTVVGEDKLIKSNRTSDQSTTESPTDVEDSATATDSLDANNPSLDMVTMKYTRVAQQKEAFDFLWTPALLIQQSLDDSSFVSYPPE